MNLRQSEFVYTIFGTQWNLNFIVDRFLLGLHYCAAPTMSSVAVLFSISLTISLVYRYLIISRIPKWSKHLLSICGGIFIMYFNFSMHHVYHVVAYGFFTYVLLILTRCFAKPYSTITFAIIAVVYLIFSEIFVEVEIWKQLRGVQMIIAMKAISVAYDYNYQFLPWFTSYFGYIFNLTTSFFGPWIRHKEYDNFQTAGLTLYNFFKIFVKLLGATVFITFSNCWGYVISTEYGGLPFHVYRDALMYRSSHYFVMLFTEIMLITGGLPATKAVDIMRIEFPRSMASVVINWNIPMHRWLKYYVFRPAYNYLGTMGAIGCVYVVSAALHGFNMSLALVLFSLGVYAYVEFMVRFYLSERSSCCILSHECNVDCGHRYKKYHPVTMTVNIFFSLISMFQLAYLGVIFEEIVLARVKDELFHSISLWASFFYIGHVITVLLFFALWSIEPRDDGEEE